MKKSAKHKMTKEEKAQRTEQRKRKFGRRSATPDLLMSLQEEGTLRFQGETLKLIPLISIKTSYCYVRTRLSRGMAVRM